MNPQLHYQIEQYFFRKCELCDAQDWDAYLALFSDCLLYTSPSPRDRQKSRMPSSA